MTCEACERFPIGSFNGQALCATHFEQWANVETRHAPNLSGPAPQERQTVMLHSRGKGHIPRHYK